MTSTEFEELRQRAVQLRRYGRTRAQIAEALSASQRMLCKLLEGEPPPAWTARPRAKDELRERARELRLKGWTYRQIVSELGVSKGSVSLWVRDLPSPPERYDQLGRARHASEVRRRASRLAREQRKAEAAGEVGHVSERDLFVAGVVAYWAEGTKDKSAIGGQLQQQVKFVNSDRTMIELFGAWLDLLGVSRSDRIYRIQIHESADVDAALRYWSRIVDADPTTFRRTTLKRHNARTVRVNVGTHYHGCLCINVRRSSLLYQQIEGWWRGIATGVEGIDVRTLGLQSPVGLLAGPATL